MPKVGLFGVSLLAIAGMASAQVEFSQTKDAVVIRVDGKEFSSLRFGQERNKPYLHPLRTASGKAITRGYPDDPQPGELQTIPHQVGLWMGHERTNGVDYWEVDPSYKLKRPVGRVVFKDVTRMEGATDHGVLSFAADWISPEGQTVVREERTMTIRAQPKDCRMIDVEFVLHPKVPLTISDHTDGILGLRLGAPFEERNGGKVLIFTGAQGADVVIGKRSPWLEFEAVIDGEHVGVLIMDHPDNYNFPTRWKVRTFASIFASPFAEKDFYHEKPFDGTIPNGAKDAGITLKADETMTFHYRVLIHPIPMDLNAAWQEFARPATSDIKLISGSN